MMQPSYMIRIILVSLSICCLGAFARRAPLDPAYPWVGFALSLQWPAGFCEIDTGCDHTSLLNTFFVHGFLPYNSNGGLLENCPGTDFNLDSISEFRADMYLNWPTTLIKWDYFDNWKFEWETHGRCSASLLNQTHYFRTAVAFKKTFDVLGLLNNHGIYANNSVYRREVIKNAFKEKLNIQAAFTLVENENSESVLAELTLCVDQLARKFIDCPTDSTSIYGDFLSPEGDHDATPVKFVSFASQVKEDSPQSMAGSSVY